MTAPDPSPRIAPLAAPYPPEIAEALARWMPPGAAVEPLALFRTLVRHGELAQAMHGTGSFLLSRRSRLTRREREIVIDRTCARCGCEYEWGVHVAAFAAAAELGAEEIAATIAAPGAAAEGAWREGEALLLRLVDALHDTGGVPDALWQALAKRYDELQLLELLALVGWYHLISFVANGARVPREAWAARFPEASAPGGG